MQSIIKHFVREKKKEDEEIEEKEFPQDSDVKEFKSFSETYKIITFALTFGLLYPNPATRWFRFIGISLMIASSAPIAMFILIDIYYCWLRMDIIEIIRHITILGPFLACFLKMCLFEWYISEKWWMVTVLTCVMIFPLMAAIFTLYSYLFQEVPQRYMVHELNKPWSKDPETRFESPYYELINVYMLYCAILYVLNFLGYDGFYGIAINHAVLKIQMYCKAMGDAMTYGGEELYQRVVGVIHEQNRTFRYMDHIQECFNLWLGLIFLATMIQLCNLLYYMTAVHSFDLRYFIFISGVTIHIYLPCHYSAKLKFALANVPTQFYCCGWESVYDERIRRLLLFMIARAQAPREITAVGMITFNRELFVQILQTSYSMYTLLSS